MGLIKTIGNIFCAKAKELDGALKNPERDMDLAIDDSKKQIRNFQEKISKLNAQQKLIEREAKEKEAKVAQLQAMAAKAVEAGNDEDALQILQQQDNQQSALNTLKSQVTTNRNDIMGARKQLQAMQAKVKKAEIDKQRLGVRMQSAKIREGLAKARSEFAGDDNPLSALDDLEDAVNAAEAKAEATEEDVSMEAGSIDEDLEKKYGGGASVSAQDKLAALKAKMAGE